MLYLRPSLKCFNLVKPLWILLYVPRVSKNLKCSAWRNSSRSLNKCCPTLTIMIDFPFKQQVTFSKKSKKFRPTLWRLFPSAYEQTMIVAKIDIITLQNVKITKHLECLPPRPRWACLCCSARWPFTPEKAKKWISCPIPYNGACRNLGTRVKHK